MKIGVIGLQGDVEEHITAAKRAMDAVGLSGDVIQVRRREHLDTLSGVILPGGESTTISKLMIRYNIMDPLKSMVQDGLPIMGTCAGLVLLSKEGDSQVKNTGTVLLGLMDMEVRRNAFGRQRESFEVDLEIEGFTEPYRGVFIRAPGIVRCWGNCRILSRVGELGVMAVEDNMMALAFHPELTEDTRVHEMFFSMI